MVCNSLNRHFELRLDLYILLQVKFFERKKLTRKIRSIDGKIKKSESSKETKKLNKEREKVKEDLAVRSTCRPV